MGIKIKQVDALQAALDNAGGGLQIAGTWQNDNQAAGWIEMLDIGDSATLTPKDVVRIHLSEVDANGTDFVRESFAGDSNIVDLMTNGGHLVIETPGADGADTPSPQKFAYQVNGITFDTDHVVLEVELVFQSAEAIGPGKPQNSRVVFLPAMPAATPEGVVKADGSVPFTQPQAGVDPEEDDELATKRYVDSALEPVLGEWEKTGLVGDVGSMDNIRFEPNGVANAKAIVVNTNSGLVKYSHDKGKVWNNVHHANINVNNATGWSGNQEDLVIDRVAMMTSETHPGSPELWNVFVGLVFDMELEECLGYAYSSDGAGWILQGGLSGETSQTPACKVGHSSRFSRIAAHSGGFIWVISNDETQEGAIATNDFSNWWSLGNSGGSSSMIMLHKSSSYWIVWSMDGVPQYSSNAQEWANISLPSNGEFGLVTANHKPIASIGDVVIAPWNDYNEVNNIVRSTDGGATFTAHNIAYTGPITVYGGKFYIFHRNAGNRLEVAVSEDGLTWSLDETFTLDSGQIGDIGDYTAFASDVGGVLGVWGMLFYNVFRRTVQSIGDVMSDGSVPFSAPVPGVTPTEDAHLATKAYVDGRAAVATEYTDDGFTSTGSGPYTTVLDNTFVTANNTVPVADWAAEKSAMLFVNGVYVPLGSWAIGDDGNDGHEITLTTTYEVASGDEITIIVRHA